MHQCQYLKRAGKTPACFDTDPINQTFSKFRALAVTHLKLSDGKDDEINPRKFDDLMGQIMSASDDANGSFSYLLHPAEFSGKESELADAMRNLITEAEDFYQKETD